MIFTKKLVIIKNLNVGQFIYLFFLISNTPLQKQVLRITSAKQINSLKT